MAISEGLIGDPLLIGLFLCGSTVGSSVIVELLVVHGAGVTGGAEIKTPQPGGSSRGLRVTVRYQLRLWSHALGKYDGDACSDASGNECDHAFSFPS
ncbi:hypothetical protein PJ267_00855 [Arthrobacter sp. OVS8]|nr:hypothetical protein PJ267_00855 [Arthrobacter sp. OVS8]